MVNIIENGIYDKQWRLQGAFASNPSFEIEQWLDIPAPPSALGPSMLWTRLAYSTKVGQGISYLRAACDRDRPSFSTEKMASAMVSGRQDLSGPRSRNRKLCTSVCVFQHFCHIDWSWYWQLSVEVIYLRVSIHSFNSMR